MKIVQINATCGQGSTGKICVAVSELLSKNNIDNLLYYSVGKSDYPKGVKYANLAYTKTQALKSKVLGNYGFNSRTATKRLIKALKAFSPEVVHLHNLHAHNANLEMLFRFLKKEKIRVFWTFHDCWAFTAYCPYFDIVHCNRWQEECHSCPQRKRFSWFFDRSQKNFRRKRNMINGVDLTVITPSQWLKELVKLSFFKDVPIHVIHNGINLAVFKPRQSDFRERFGIRDKFILLGVANGWDARKGIADFNRLAEHLDQDRFQIVLVGVSDEGKASLSQNILALSKTCSQEALAQIYTAADLFVNPTREDNYPTVNIEALACGTPVLTYATGGSGEIPDESCGLSIPIGDEKALEEAILFIADQTPFSREACLTRAAFFDENERFSEVISLYEKHVLTVE